MLKKRIASLIIALATAVSLNLGVFAEAEATAEDITGENQSQIVRASNFTLPTNVISTVIEPEVNYCTTEDYDEESAAVELDSVYSRMTEIGLNTVYIRTTHEGRAFFSTDMNKSEQTDYIKLAIDMAYSYNIKPILVLDLNYIVSLSKNSATIVDTLVSHVHRFTLKYPCEGIIIDNYYCAPSSEMYDRYMSVGGGIGYENWLYDTSELYFSTASEIIHLTNNSIPVGIMVNDMWANRSSNELGSDTEDIFEAHYDGFTDTKSFLEKGYVDFAVIHCYGSIESGILPFENVAQWWSELCTTNGVTMYLMMCNDKMGTAEGDWWREDQLLRQLALASEMDSFGGCVFRSYDKLINDSVTTGNLKKYFGNEIDVETLFEDLIMQSPKNLSFTTYEPYIDFMGTFDANFDVYFNGSKIILNDAGNFYFEEPLSVGQNKFTIEHKGTVYTYRIERKVIPMKSLGSSIAEGKTLEVSGGTTITLTANAYKDSTVIATVNGQSITLKQTDVASEDDSNSSYFMYTGTYRVPSGIIGLEQELGAITVTADYMGYQTTIYGANVTVLADPEPIIPDINSSLVDQNSAGTGEVVGTMDPIYTEDDYVKYVRVSNDFTIVYDGATAGDIATPDFAQLPAGTLDYYYAASGSYYLTQSGKRIAQSAATVFEDTGLGENALVVNSVGSYENYSYIKIKLDYKSSYNIDFIGNTYYAGDPSNYMITDFGATHVAITFDNITSVTKLPSFENSYVFSSGEWEVTEVDGIPKFRLLLKLRQKGVYSGCSARYNSEGELELRFPIMSKSLSDLVVVIDPGHGYCKYEGVLDPGAVGHVTEFDANLPIAKELESQLTACGATVIRIKSESEFSFTNSRPSYGRPYNANMFISIHANKIVGNESVRGTEVYYFTPYSQPLAAQLSSNIASYFTNNVYSDGADKNRGARYSYYWVTLQQDFPSVLIETGFVSNLEDAMAIVNAEHQKGIARAIVTGIQNYIARSSISLS